MLRIPRLYSFANSILIKIFLRPLLPGICLFFFISYPFPLIPYPCLFASFEDVSSGARMRSLGGAFVSLADDNETIFVQPAGITNITFPEFSFTFGRPIVGLSDGSEISDNVVLFAIPVLKHGGAGLGYKNTSLKQAYTEETMTGSFAWKFKSIISTGLSIKYLRIKYDSDNYTRIDPVFSNTYERTGADIDFGILIKLLPYLNFGYSGQNILGTDMGIKDQNKTLRVDRFGFTYKEETLSMNVEGVLKNSNYQLLSGIEKTFFRDLLGVRVGVGTGSMDFRQFSAGIGINFRQFRLDYAWDRSLSGIEKTSGTHYLTVFTRIGKSETAKKSENAKAQIKDSQIQTKILTSEAVISNTPANIANLTPKSTDTIFLPLIQAPIYQVQPETVISTVVTATPSIKKKENAFKQEPPKKIKTTVPKLKLTQTSTEQPAGMTHKVVGGDTLPMLAEKYYGKKTKWLKIYEANKDKIEKGSLKQGEILIIP